MSDDEILIIDHPIARQDLAKISARRFGDMVKAVVDLERNAMAIGGDLHADEEEVLLDSGSSQANLWGINIYHALPREEWVEFDSMINIRPSQGNRSRSVEDEGIRSRIVALVNALVTG